MIPDVTFAKKRNCGWRSRVLLLGSGTRSQSTMTNSLRLNSADALCCQPLRSQYRALQFVLKTGLQVRLGFPGPALEMGFGKYVNRDQQAPMQKWLQFSHDAAQPIGSRYWALKTRTPRTACPPVSLICRQSKLPGMTVTRG